MKDFPTPSVLECFYLAAESRGREMRVVRDYEFDFYVGGERDIYIDDCYYKVFKGALVFKKPGQVAVGYGDYDTYMLTLDLSGKARTLPDRYIRESYTPEQELCDYDVFDLIPAVFFPAHADDITDLYKKIAACSYPNIPDTELQRQYVTELLFLVLADAVQYGRELTGIKKDKENYTEKACRYINKHYARNVSVDDLANHLSLNKNYMIKLFKKELAVTPGQYLLGIRLFHAKTMLLYTDQSVKSIAVCCGFNTESYFIKCFKKSVGKTPAAYRKSASRPPQ